MRALRTGWIVVAFAFLASAGQAVVIDEFFYGTDALGNDEWIELYNRSSVDINLTSWSLAVANNGPFVKIHTITTGTGTGATLPGSFAAGTTESYHLITDGPGTGRNYDENYINLNMARPSGPLVVYGIALVNDLGTTIDTVLYAAGGAANVFNLRDDDNQTTLTRVRVVTGDQAYRRDPPHQDTNNSSVDFAGTGDTGDPVPVEISRFELD